MASTSYPVGSTIHFISLFIICFFKLSPFNEWSVKVCPFMYFYFSWIRSLVNFYFSNFFLRFWFNYPFWIFLCVNFISLNSALIISLSFWSGRCPGEGNGNPHEYSRLENPMDGGAWGATVHGVSNSRTGLSNFTLLPGFLSLFCWNFLGISD